MKKYEKSKRKPRVSAKNLLNMNNAVEPATTTNKDWGYIPCPYKGGKTLNSRIFSKDN